MKIDPATQTMFTLITGASSGIGAEFARQYARRRHPLVLVARSVDKLNQLAEELRNLNKIQVHTISLDLAQIDSAEKLFQECQHLGIEVSLLINNAGVGLIGEFDSDPIYKIDEMLILNTLTLTKIIYLFLPQLKKYHGKIINVASQAAYMSAPYMSAYAATKAYVLSLSNALRVELENSRIRVMALCPGPTYTKFFERAHTSPQANRGRFKNPADVVEQSFEAIKKHRPITIVGRDNRLMCFLTRLLPRTFVAHLAKYMVKNK